MTLPSCKNSNNLLVRPRISHALEPTSCHKIVDWLDVVFYVVTASRYARCVFFATKTAMSVGRNPKPTNVAEYVFMAASWLLGVFVFAILLGQVSQVAQMRRIGLERVAPVRLDLSRLGGQVVLARWSQEVEGNRAGPGHVLVTSEVRRVGSHKRRSVYLH